PHDLWVLAEEAEVRLHRRAQRVARELARRVELHLFRVIAREAAALHFGPQRFLAAEVMMDEALGHARSLGDLAHRCAGEALLDEGHFGRVEDRGAGGLGVVAAGSQRGGHPWERSSNWPAGQ